ncbi:MAG: endonuclease III [Pedosphaera sp.]|nr:endonuclease III [Pedosphaera sp.]
MPRESKTARQDRVNQINALLQATYPNAHCKLNFSNPLELLIATILSAQCTDNQVNTVTAGLFKKYFAVADYAAADPLTFENDIRRIGLFRNKAKNIQACCRTLTEDHGGEVPRTMEALVQLAGVGRKTANVVLGCAFKLAAGIVVDTHVARLAGRLNFTTATQPIEIESDLVNLIPKDRWIDFSHWLIWHGRRRCRARKPNCTECEISSLCPSNGMG